MNKPGISAFAWTGCFSAKHLDLLATIRRHGFACAEIPMFDPRKLPAAELRQRLEEEALDCTICAILPAGINPISPEQSIRRRSVEHLRACVETAAEIGAKLLGGPILAPIGYLPGHRPTDDEWSWAVEAIQSLGELLERTEVTLSIEPVNRSETFFLRTAVDARRFCTAVGLPMVGVTLDTFHANIEEKSISAAIRYLGPTLKHMHVSENDRGLLGSGHVDFQEIAKALGQTGYEGYLIVEGFGYVPDDPSAPGALWAEPTTSPDQLAGEGILFLQSLMQLIG